MNVTVVILAFVAVYQLSNRVKLSAFACATLVVAFPLALSIILAAIGGSWWSVLQLKNITIFALTYLAYFLIFFKSQQDDSMTSWFLYGIAGVVAAPILIPLIVGFI